MIKCGRLASKNATARLTTTRTNTIGYIGMYVRVIGTYAVSEKCVHRAHLEARVSRMLDSVSALSLDFSTALETSLRPLLHNIAIDEMDS